MTQTTAEDITASAYLNPGVHFIDIADAKARQIPTARVIELGQYGGTIERDDEPLPKWSKSFEGLILVSGTVQETGLFAVLAVQSGYNARQRFDRLRRKGAWHDAVLKVLDRSLD